MGDADLTSPDAEDLAQKRTTSIDLAADTADTADRADAAASDESRLLPPVLTAVLGVVVVGLAGASVYFGVAVHRADTEERVRHEVIAAAKQEAVNLTSQDYATIARDFDRMLAGATGDLRSDLDSQRSRYGDTFVKNKLRAEGAATDAGLVTMRGGQATVLVVVDQTVRSESKGKQQAFTTRRYRLELDMAQVNGRWLAANLRAAGLVS